jgi:hypothetical protein
MFHRKRDVYICRCPARWAATARTSQWPGHRIRRALPRRAFASGPVLAAVAKDSVANTPSTSQLISGFRGRYNL